MSIKLSITLIAFELIIVFFCLPSTLGIANPKTKLAFNDIHMGMSEIKLKQAGKSFVLSSGGTFGNKSQYQSLEYDSDNGVYVVHLKAGKCFGIEVIYQKSPIPKAIALKRLHGFLPVQSNLLNESDELELVNSKSQSPAETYYYFGKSNYNGILLFARHSNHLVSKISLWHNPNDR